MDPPKVKLDREGIPVVKYPGIGYQANPVSVAQYGLWGYGTHRDEVALRAARWLLAHQQPDGRWLYRFDFALDGVAIEAPWPSAMAQGQAMSLLERVYRLTGQQRYLAAAVRALKPLNAKVSAGGVQRCFRGDCHLLWLEEYPTSPPTYVLNGFMFTLIGLYDLASVAPRTDALALYRRGRQTLDHVLPLYDDHGAATYDLSAEHPVAAAKYQMIHVYLLRALNALSPDRRYLFYANRWLATL